MRYSKEDKLKFFFSAVVIYIAGVFLNIFPNFILIFLRVVFDLISSFFLLISQSATNTGFKFL